MWRHPRIVVDFFPGQCREAGWQGIPATLESMPVWSKASKASTEKKAEVVSVSQGHEDGSEELRKWLSGLKPVTGADTMLRFVKTPEGAIDLSNAHPSGLAQ